MVVPRRQTVADRFERFHRENPRIYGLFKQYAEQARASGRRRFSADAILHRIRWFVTIETKGEFKVNDCCSAFYARLLIAEDATFDGFFELRRSAADRPQGGG